MTTKIIMTPDEIQNAAMDMHNQVRKTEIQLREQVRGWFSIAKPTVYNTINNELIAQTVANIEQSKIIAHIGQFNTKMLYKSPLNIMRPAVLTKIIEDESGKQCNLMGEFIKAQGHNLPTVRTINDVDFGIHDILCEFTFVVHNTVDCQC